MNRTKIILSCFLIIVLSRVYPINIMDSLINALKTEKKDTQIFKIHKKIVGLYINNQPNNAIPYAFKNLELSKDIQNPKLIGEAYSDLGNIFYNLGKLDTAVIYYKLAADNSKLANDDINYAFTLVSVGVIYSIRGNYSESMKYFFDALKIFEKYDNKKGISNCLNNIGIIYDEQNNYEKALQYYKKSLKIREEIGSKRGISNALNNIAIIYSKMKSFDTAITYYDKSLVISREINDKKSIAITLGNIGKIYASLKKFDKAIDYHYKSMKIKEEIDDKKGLCVALYNIGETHCLNKNYKGAIPFFEKSIKISKEIGDKNILMGCYKTLGDLYTNTGEYKKALDYKNLYIEIKDTIFNDQSTKQIVELQTKYETETKIKEIEILKKDKEVQNLKLKKNNIIIYSFLSGLILLIFLALVIYKAYKTSKKNNKILTEKNNEIESQNKEIQQQRDDLRQLNKDLCAQKSEIDKQKIILEELNNDLLIHQKEISEKNEILVLQNETLQQQKEEIEVQRNMLEELNQNLEKKVREEVLKNREKEMMLVMQSRQALMGEMIGNIAHQWRQPLNALAILFQNLQEAYNYNDLSKEYIDSRTEKAMNLIQYMSQTIDDFRNFFKPNREKNTFSIKDVVERSIAFVEVSFKSLNIEIENQIQSDFMVSGFPNEYAQVIVNILNNSKDAFIERNIHNPVIKIRLKDEMGKSILSINDNAGGINNDISKKIFEPYFTTKNNDKGTGLGLYMSKTIIEKNMNGYITVENIDDGVEFRIVI